MPRRASEPYRQGRVNNKWEYKLTELDILEAHFPLYFTHYLVPDNRGQSLPKGWIGRNMVQLTDDFADAAGVQSVLARNFLGRMNNTPNWFAQRFKKIRDVLGDHIIVQRRNTAALGQPGSHNPVRQAARHAALMENEEYEMELRIRRGDVTQRDKEERDRERNDKVATSLAAIYVNNEYDDVTALMNRILHQPIDYVSDLTIPCATHSLPFGKPTVFEALQYGLRYRRYLHFNFCTTTRPENQEEYVRYLSQDRNPIFSPFNQRHLSLDRQTLLVDPNQEYDLKFTTIKSYRGSAGNGKDNLLLALESKLQGLFHRKAPVGTLGYRWDKAGHPNGYWNDDEERVCSLMLVWSESKFLEKVRDNELCINPTRRAGANAAFNNRVWDDNSWEPVLL
ncbi:hypothetical protein FRACYDRAFT_251401 [Fragilariopsis cylindrus CCMP1102]|uniref:Uncharacterized protein n=1 Tax=Fragilariopsis cylindrus CCMP1102 TaxID=635003 RepID=A0A1E7EN84_9STRA|nr:hypothetical protein FRACYDRAFT_251401 [Fragilariopsis cylindrus CCMP1102]|eukprot:OEU07276.1 hypothetical protein FRACYDRAFT_251401 [Fragilariopsis cylindrus CCMP1102]